MSIYLRSEFETVIFGEDGLITISQKYDNGEEAFVFLSVNQFQSMLDSAKALIEEALVTP